MYENDQHVLHPGSVLCNRKLRTETTATVNTYSDEAKHLEIEENFKPTRQGIKIVQNTYQSFLMFAHYTTVFFNFPAVTTEWGKSFQILSALFRVKNIDDYHS